MESPPNFTCLGEDVSTVISQLTFFRPFMPYYILWLANYLVIFILRDNAYNIILVLDVHHNDLIFVYIAE